MATRAVCRECGRPGCDGAEHICGNCGANVDHPINVLGKIYCSAECAYLGEPDHPVYRNVPPEVAEQRRRALELQARAKALKKELEDAGLPWPA